MSLLPRRSLLVVVHTHWDREWYHHAARFRQRLVALIDAALSPRDAAAPPLLLDGQTIVLDDYLTVRPDRAPTIASALGEGRIAAGPWFVLADLLIPMGESLIRNLFAGERTLRRFGATAPPVLYAPDAFGHPAYLPTIAAGFGFPVTVLWRGYGGARWPAGDTARWRAPDGSETVLVHLPPDGYEFGSSLPGDPAAMRERADRIDAVLGPRATTGTALLTVGADHHAVDPELPQALALLRTAAHALDWDVDLVTMHEAANRLHAAARDHDLPVVTGELRESCGYVWALQGTLATRSNQKRRHAQLERRLIDEVEPMAALAWFAGATRERRDGSIEAHQLPVLLDAVWRDLLTCHPHDTLAGCSTDAVARAMDARLDAVHAQLEGLEQAALDRIIEHDRVAARRAAPHGVPRLVLRNRVGRARAGLVEIELVRAIADEPVGPGSSASADANAVVPPVPEQLTAVGMVQSLDRQIRRDRLESPLHYPDNDVVIVDRLLAWCASPVPPMGVCTRSALISAETAAAPRSDVVHARETSVGTVLLENGQLRVEVSAHGLRVRDETGEWSERSVVQVTDEDDRGDSYTPEPVGEARSLRFAEVTMRHAGPWRASAVVALRTPDHDQRCELELEVSLDARSRQIGVAVRGNNAAGNHRVRLLIACDGQSTRTVADSGFGVVSREHAQVPDDEQHEEAVIHAAPLHRWVATPDGRPTVVVSDGIPEYERLEDGVLALTVLRCTGSLSRNDLHRRRGHAGWPVDVPDAQQIGSFSARCWIGRLASDTAHDAIAAAALTLADEVLRPLTATTVRDALRPFQDAALLEVEGMHVAIGSIKPSEDRQSLVVRLHNSSVLPQRARLRCGVPISRAARARLDETPGSALPVHEQLVEIDLAPHGTETVLLFR